MNNNTACIIVNYNDSQRTVSLLEHIKDFSSIDFLIVVDNCSTDDSYKNLSAFSHPKYHLIKSPNNGGYGYGNNLGARKAASLKSKYLLIANPDVVFDDECVRNMKHVINSNDSYGIVGAKETHLGISGWKYTSSLHDVLSASLLFNKILKKRYYPPKYFEGEGIVNVDLVPGCMLLVDIDKFFQVGMYDEAVFLYEEEKILYKRMSDAGFVSVIDLKSSYQHMHKESHSTNMTAILKGKRRLLDSRMYYLREYRHMNYLALCGAKLFFLYSLLEMFVYGLILNCKK